MLQLVHLVNYKFSYIYKLCRKLIFLLDPLNIYVKSNLKHFMQHQQRYCSKAVYGCKRDRIYYLQWLFIRTNWSEQPLEHKQSSLAPSTKKSIFNLFFPQHTQRHQFSLPLLQRVLKNQYRFRLPHHLNDQLTQGYHRYKYTLEAALKL